jgi:hypothetical protein
MYRQSMTCDVWLKVFQLYDGEKTI